jgi:hypothetical protein
MDLIAYADILDFDIEYPLTREPLRVDVIIIKKKKDVVIKKNIAAIFRGRNIVEYSQPGAPGTKGVFTGCIRVFVDGAMAGYYSGNGRCAGDADIGAEETVQRGGVLAGKSGRRPEY